jgi:hypothetical protein
MKILNLSSNSIKYTKSNVRSSEYKILERGYYKTYEDLLEDWRSSNEMCGLRIITALRE